MLGAYVSYFLNGSTGGCIVTLQTAVFVLTLFFAPKHGIVAARRKARRTTTALLMDGGIKPASAQELA
jgi:manganese/iron transport system permease protein